MDVLLVVRFFDMAFVLFIAVKMIVFNFYEILCVIVKPSNRVSCMITHVALAVCILAIETLRQGRGDHFGGTLLVLYL